MQKNSFKFPKTLEVKGTWTNNGTYNLKESQQGEEGYHAFYEREVGFGFKHAIEIASAWLESDPTKKLIEVKNLTSFAKMKASAPDRWLIANQQYYYTIEDAIGALTGQTKVYKPKRKPEIIRDLTEKQIREYWGLPEPKEESE
jgi:hypothetical protein